MFCLFWQQYINFTCRSKPKCPYLHDDKEDQSDEHIDLRMFPGLSVPDVVELLSNALFGPSPIVQ